MNFNRDSSVDVLSSFAKFISVPILPIIIFQVYAVILASGTYTAAPTFEEIRER